jgi:hypothetical protein
MSLHKVFFHLFVRRVRLHHSWIAILLLLIAFDVSAQLSVSTNLPGPTLLPFPSMPGLAERRLVLAPFLAVGERYDDNIFEDASNKESGFVTVITPGLRLHYRPQPETTLDFDYRTSFEIFHDNPDQNQSAHYANLQFKGPLTRSLTLNVFDRFLLTEDPAERDLDQGPSGSDQTREDVLRNEASLAVGIQLTPRIVFTPSFSSLLWDVTDPDEVDEFRYTLGAEVAYLTQIARQNQVFVSYSADFYHLANNPTNDPLAFRPDATDFRVYSTSIGYRHSLTPTLLADVAIGYSIAISVDPDRKDEDSVVGTVGLSKQLRTGRAGVRYSRQFFPGVREGGRVLGDVFSAFIATNITPKITVGLSSTLSLLSYKDVTNDDRLFWIIRPSLTYQMLRFWSISAAYDYALTDFDNPDRADRNDQRFLLLSQFAIRDKWFINLSYRHSSRHFDQSFIVVNGQIVDSRDDNPFDRNEVLLTVTFSWPFLLR